MTASLQEYMKLNKKVGNWGISYLDYKLKGIYQGGLYLIGARSGAGKSTLAELIAVTNANNGVIVTLISLENFEGDMQLKIGYYKYKKLTGNVELDINDWYSGNFNVDEQALASTELYVKEKMKNINLITRPSKGFTVEDLKETITDAKANHNSELVIIDHLDYFDKAGRESDNEHMTMLMNEIREAQYALKLPVIAISHLRKNGDKACIVPSMDEFIGSSNKVKQATTVILFAPDETTNINRVGTLDDRLRSTWCCIRKNRVGGVDNTVGRIEYDTRTCSYTDFWCEHKIEFYGTKISENIVNTSKKYKEKKDVNY